MHTSVAENNEKCRQIACFLEITKIQNVKKFNLQGYKSEKSSKCSHFRS